MVGWSSPFPGLVTAVSLEADVGATIHSIFPLSGAISSGHNAIKKIDTSDDFNMHNEHTVLLHNVYSV